MESDNAASATQPPAAPPAPSAAPPALSAAEDAKRRAAEAAAAYVQPGMLVGLGTGTTATHLIARLIQRVRTEGLRFTAIPTSQRSADQAEAGGIPLSNLGAHPKLDLTIDGADQIERTTLNLIKGMGGALLREKIVAAASARLVIIADASKLADQLTLPIPVEVTPFGWQATAAHLTALGATPTLRQTQSNTPYITDGGNHILDCAFPPLQNPAATEVAIRAIVGVIESGLFIARATEIILAGPNELTHLTPAGK